MSIIPSHLSTAMAQLPATCVSGPNTAVVSMATGTIFVHEVVANSFTHHSFFHHGLALLHEQFKILTFYTLEVNKYTL